LWGKPGGTSDVEVQTLQLVVLENLLGGILFWDDEESLLE